MLRKCKIMLQSLKQRSWQSLSLIPLMSPIAFPVHRFYSTQSHNRLVCLGNRVNLRKASSFFQMKRVTLAWGIIWISPWSQSPIFPNVIPGYKVSVGKSKLCHSILLSMSFKTKFSFGNSFATTPVPVVTAAVD